MSDDSFEKHARDVQSACDWLKSRGVDFESSRIAQYNQDAKIVAQHAAAGTLRSIPKADYERLLNSLLESHELVGIWKGLRDSNDPTIAARLSRLPLKEALMANETLDMGGNDPRNISFELYFQGLLARAGVTLSSHKRCDVVVPFEGTEFMIECKRAFREGGFRNGIDSARTQLIAKHAEDPTRRGLIVISVSRLYLFEDGEEVCGESLEDLSRGFASRIREIATKNDWCLNVLVEDHIVGVIVFLKAPAYLGAKVIFQDTLLFIDLKRGGHGVIAEMQEKLEAVLGASSPGRAQT